MKRDLKTTTVFRIYRTFCKALDMKPDRRATQIFGKTFGHHFVFLDSSLKKDLEYVNTSEIVLSGMYYKIMKTMGTTFMESMVVDDYVWRRKRDSQIDLMTFLSFYALDKEMDQASIIFSAIDLAKKFNNLLKSNELVLL